MTPIRIHRPAQSLLWISDIHLDKASPREKTRFLKLLTTTHSDAVLLTGDISTSPHIVSHLGEIAAACGDRTIMFTLGNHDYFGSSFSAVDLAVADVCSRHSNLIALGHGEIIELTKHTALVGHRGWFDGQAGAGRASTVVCPDRQHIHDFRSLTENQFYHRLGELGEESAMYFRKILPLALTRYRNLLIGTHVPTFTQSVRYNGNNCQWHRQPFFQNRAAGNLIFGISKNFSKRRITVLAGHSHSSATVWLTGNLCIRVAGATPGFPGIEDLLTIS